MSTFISYSRANSDFAVRLAKDLKAAGFDVWLDQLDIPTGARWDDEIEKALEKSTIFLIVLSPESIESQNVKDEVGYAIDSGKHILPVVTKTCKIPLRLRRFQFVDFSNKPYEDSLTEIKHLLSNTSKLTAAKAADEAVGPPAQIKANAQVTRMSQAKQAPAKKLKSTKTNQMWYLAILFIGICAVAAIGFMVIMFSSSNLAGLIRPPAPKPPMIVTTAAPSDTPKPIALDITVTPSETTVIPSDTPVTPSVTPTFTPTFTLTAPPNFCDQVAGQSLKINTGSGFQGVIGPSGLVLISKGNARYEFTTVAAFPNEQLDAVSGVCEGSTLKFTRTRPQAFTQDYQAEISKSPNGLLSLNGSLTNRASGKTVSLSGQVTGAVTPRGLCDQLTGKSINTKHANGFQGVIGPSGITLIAKGDGTYSFSTVAAYTNEPSDPVVGSCQGNMLTFTRTRTNQFTQDFQATISQNGGILFFEGSLTTRETGKKGTWSGQVTNPHP